MTRGGAEAERRARAARLDRSKEPPEERQAVVTVGVDAGMDVVQKAAASPAHHRVARDPAAPQLLVVDHAPLTGGKLRSCAGCVWLGLTIPAHLVSIAAAPANKQGAIAAPL